MLPLILLPPSERGLLQLRSMKLRPILSGTGTPGGVALPVGMERRS